jgi:hypothetical protein
MATIINASTSAGLVQTADTSGDLNIQSGGSTIVAVTSTGAAVTGTLSASGNITSSGATGGIGYGPAFSAYNSTNQSITTTTYTKLTFDTEEFDTNSNFATSRFTPTVAGYYQFDASLYPQTTVTTNNCAFYKNGSIFKVTAGATGGAINCCALIYMNGSTDYVELYGFLIGVTPAYLGSSGLSYFQACLVRSA